MSKNEKLRAFVLSEGDYFAIITAVSEDEARRIFRQRLDSPEFSPDIDFSETE